MLNPEWGSLPLAFVSYFWEPPLISRAGEQPNHPRHLLTVYFDLRLMDSTGLPFSGLFYTHATMVSRSPCHSRLPHHTYSLPELVQAMVSRTQENSFGRNGTLYVVIHESRPTDPCPQSDKETAAATLRSLPEE